MSGKDAIRGSTENSLQARLVRHADLRYATIAAAAIESGSVASIACNSTVGTVSGSVSYLGSNAKVALVRAGPQSTAARCSRCGDTSTPNLCWHSAALLGHLLHHAKNQAKCTLTIESDGSFLIARPQDGRSTPPRPLASRLAQMGFVLNNAKLVLNVEENPTDAYQAITQWLPAMARGNDIRLGDGLWELVSKDHELYVDFAISGGELVIKLRSNALNKGELLDFVSANRGRSLQGAQAICTSRTRLVMWGPRESRVVELLALLGVAPSAACSRKGASLPLAMAFRAKAAIERLYPDVRTLAGSLDEFCSVTSESSPPSCVVPQHLDGQLKPWQEEGFFRLQQHYRLGLGLLLADPMGLGKTIQAIAHVYAVAKSKPFHDGPIAMVCCPSSLCGNWMAEFARWAPDLRVKHICGSMSERWDLISECPSSDHEVLLCTYDTVWRDAHMYREFIELEVFIIDEAQAIKNASSKRSRGVKTIGAAQKVALTGTPYENSIDDVRSILEFVTGEDAYLGKKKQYAALKDGLAHDDGESISFFEGLLEPFTIRRPATLLNLPELSSEVMEVRLDDESATVYEAIRLNTLEVLNEMTDGEFSSFGGQNFILAKIQNLRKACLNTALIRGTARKTRSAKEVALIQIAEQVDAKGEKMIVFTDMVSEFPYLQEALDRKEISWCSITGDTPINERQELVNSFNDDRNDTVVMLMSLKLATGLNVCGPQGGGRPLKTVVHANPWWNPASRAQATARVHRMGQAFNVREINLIASSSIEEKVWDLQQLKSTIAEHLFDAGDLSTSRLSRSQLIELLS